MKKKYTIRIQRTEYYSHDVEVEAESAGEAICDVKHRYDDGEFEGEDDLFNLPDDTECHVYCAEESEV